MADSVFKCLGASNHTDHDRAEDDFYSTDPEGVARCLNWIKNNNFLSKDFNDYTWHEPACGNLAIAKVVHDFGVDKSNIKCSDIVKRSDDDSYNIEIKDFFDLDKFEDNDNIIITNPPYGKTAEQFLIHALEILNDGDYYITLQRVQFLEGQARRKIYDKEPPKAVLVPSKRINCYKNGIVSKDKSAMCFCWFMFEKGFKGTPGLYWI